MQFLNNPSYATWAQSVVVLLSVYVAVEAVHSADRNTSVGMAWNFAQRYYSETKSSDENSYVSAFNANIALRDNLVFLYKGRREIARRNQPDYQPERDFRPLYKDVAAEVLRSISANDELKRDVDIVDNAFAPILGCIEKELCDKDTIIKLLGSDIWAFFNAACPYMEDTSKKVDTVNPGDTNDNKPLRYIKFSVTYLGHSKDSDYFCQDTLKQYRSIVSSE